MNYFHQKLLNMLKVRISLKIVMEKYGSMLSENSPREKRNKPSKRNSRSQTIEEEELKKEKYSSINDYESTRRKIY